MTGVETYPLTPIFTIVPDVVYTSLRRGNSLAFNSLIQEEKKNAHSRIKRLTFQKTQNKTLQEAETV